MGIGRRTKTNQSLFLVAKNYYKISVLGALSTLLLASGCATDPSSSGDNKDKNFQAMKKNYVLQSQGQWLTENGENEDASWSPDSQKIIFISRNRTAHKNSQVYEMDIETREERRITFSDGDASNPHYLPDGQKFLYASTTDELKERPLLLRKKETADLFSPTDLYLSTLTGLEINRLTQRPGFDGQIHLRVGSPSEFYFTSFVDNKRQIYKYSLQNKNSISVFNDQKEDRRDFTALNNKFAWVRTQPESSPVQQIVIGDGSLTKIKNISFGEAVFRDLQWVDFGNGDQKLMLTASLRDHPNSQIYFYDLAKNCLLLFIQSDKAELSQAEISPDLKKVIYTSTEIEGRRQILLKKVDLSSLTCKAIPF